MRFYGKVRTPDRRPADEEAVMRSPLGLLDAKKADGALFVALLRELASRPIPRGRKRSRMKIEMGLELAFNIKASEEPMRLRVSAGSELIYYRGGTFVLRDGMRSFRVNRRPHGIQLTSHNGFRELSGPDKWRGTGYTWHATTRM